METPTGQVHGPAAQELGTRDHQPHGGGGFGQGRSVPGMGTCHGDVFRRELTNGFFIYPLIYIYIYIL